MSRPIGRPPGAVVVVIPVATLLGHKTLSFLTAPEEPAKAKRALQKIWTAESKKDALASVPRLGRKLGKTARRSSTCSRIARRCWRSPTSRPDTWKYLRTNNVIGVRAKPQPI
jgi:hypothetical protein